MTEFPVAIETEDETELNAMFGPVTIRCASSQGGAARRRGWRIRPGVCFPKPAEKPTAVSMPANTKWPAPETVEWGRRYPDSALKQKDGLWPVVLCAFGQTCWCNITIE